MVFCILVVPSARCGCLRRNLLRSCRREVCPQEGKDDPVIEMIWSGGLRPLPTCIFSGVEAPLPSSFVSVAMNWTVHFSDTASNHLLISQNVAWRFFDNIIGSVLSHRDPLPKQFERVLLLLLLFCNLSRDVFKNSFLLQSQAAAAWLHLHLQHCTVALKIFVVCTTLWFSMKGLWITGGRTKEWGVPGHFLDSREVKWEKLIIQKMQIMHAGKISGSTNRNVGKHSCKACQTGLLAIPVLSRHPSETCFDEPVSPDHSFSLFLMTYYLVAEY